MRIAWVAPQGGDDQAPAARGGGAVGGEPARDRQVTEHIAVAILGDQLAEADDDAENQQPRDEDSGGDAAAIADVRLGRGRPPPEAGTGLGLQAFGNRIGHRSAAGAPAERRMRLVGWRRADSDVERELGAGPASPAGGLAAAGRPRRGVAAGEEGGRGARPTRSFLPPASRSVMRWPTTARDAGTALLCCPGWGWPTSSAVCLLILASPTRTPLRRAPWQPPADACGRGRSTCPTGAPPRTRTTPTSCAGWAPCRLRWLRRLRVSCRSRSWVTSTSPRRTPMCGTRPRSPAPLTSRPPSARRWPACANWD